jgi:hypothetical protein
MNSGENNIGIRNRQENVINVMNSKKEKGDPGK